MRQRVSLINEFLSYMSSNVQSVTVKDMHEILNFHCSEVDRNQKIKLVTDEEIRDVLV